MQKIVDDDLLSKETVVLPSNIKNNLELKYVKPVIDNVSGSVMIPSDVVNRGSLPYSRTLYGFFIQEKEMASYLVGYHIRNMWKTYGIEHIMDNQKGFYFFKFKTDQGMLDVLEKGPWTINKIPLFLKRWTPGLVLDKSKVPVWINIYDMPLEIGNKEGLNIIGSMLGVPLVVDTYTEARMCMKASGRAGYARVLVDVQVEYNCVHQIRLKKEKKDKRRYVAEPNLYTIIKVTRDEDLLEQIGKDVYFDLVDHDKVRYFYIKKEMPFNLFKEEVAKAFGVPVQFQRFWLWGKRQNLTYRPSRPLTVREETQPVGQLRELSNKKDNAVLKLFLEIEIGPDLHPLPPPDKTKDDLLLFFKLYDPEKEQLRYVGSFFVKSFGKPSEILSKLNERDGFSPDEEIELYEELKFEPRVNCERVDKRSSFRSSQIEDGDIICFQKLSQAQSVDKYRYPNVPSFLEYVKTLKTLKDSFHYAIKEEPVIHNIRLPKQSTVGDLLNEIETKVELSHPDAELRLLNIFSHKIYKIFRPTEKIENVNDWTLRAEEIPKEEKNLGPQDRLIHVYHFTKEAAQNQMQVRNFGEPFFLIIHENETLEAVKVRIQCKLEVPDEEFSKWKFALLSLGYPEYLQDSDIVSSRFQRSGFYGGWEQYLGLEHLDTPS